MCKNFLDMSNKDLKGFDPSFYQEKEVFNLFNNYIKGCLDFSKNEACKAVFCSGNPELKKIFLSKEQKTKIHCDKHVKIVRL